MCHRIGYGRRVKYVVNTTQRHSIFFLSSFPIFVSIKGAGNGRERCMRETLEKWKIRKSNKWNESTMKRQRHSLFILLTAFSFNQQLLISSNNQLMVRCHRCCAAAVYPHTHSHIKRNREREPVVRTLLWHRAPCRLRHTTNKYDELKQQNFDALKFQRFRRLDDDGGGSSGDGSSDGGCRYQNYIFSCILL